MVGFQKHEIKISCSGNEWAETESLIRGYSNVRVYVMFPYRHKRACIVFTDTVREHLLCTYVLRKTLKYIKIGGEKEKMENKKNLAKSITVIVVVLSVLAVAMVGTASAKSVYLVADHHGSPTPINAYDMQPGPSLVYQATYPVTSHVLGASGLAMYDDPDGNGLPDDSQILVTYEASGIIEKFDATNFNNLGNVNTGAGDLTGIVVDQGKQLAYAVSRYNKNLYVLDANTLNVLSTQTLTIDNVGYGIALDEGQGLLYVGDADNTVDYFDTTNWVEQGTITVGNPNALSVALDVANQILYTGDGFAGSASTLLCKYDLTTGVTTTHNLDPGCTGGWNCIGAIGLAVDPDLPHHLYVTTGYAGDDLRIFDSNLNQLYLYPDTEQMILNPAGICIGKASFGQLTLDKDDGLSGCVNVGNTFTYTISYQNTGQIDVNNVVITDTLPSGVTYVSCTGGGVYTAGPPETVTWTIPTVVAGASGSVSVTVTVNAGTEGTTLVNYVTIDSDETNPTTDTEQTDVCPPGGGNCCVCPSAGSTTCVCAVASDYNDCVNVRNGLWMSCDLTTDEPCKNYPCDDGTCVPEFSTIAIPVASILGLLFFFNYRKRKREQ